MAAHLPEIDFGKIRPHEGSRNLAWEELCFLVASDISGLPPETTFERRGRPDEGIEFSCEAPVAFGSGTWAWQAKYFLKLDDNSWPQMKESFYTALNATPSLTRYVFVIPTERTSIKSTKRQGQLQKWNTHRTKWRRYARDQGRDIEIEFIGASTVMNALLTNDRYAGVARYFFDLDIVTGKSIRDHVDRGLSDLGQRYDPVVSVELPLRDLVHAAARSSEFLGKIDAQGNRLCDRSGGLRHLPEGADELSGALFEAATAIDATTPRFDFRALLCHRQLSSRSLGLAGRELSDRQGQTSNSARLRRSSAS